MWVAMNSGLISFDFFEKIRKQTRSTEAFERSIKEQLDFINSIKEYEVNDEQR